VVLYGKISSQGEGSLWSASRQRAWHTTYSFVFINDLDIQFEHHELNKNFADDTKMGQRQRIGEDQEKLRRALDDVQKSGVWNLMLKSVK
jgi:hypothetical protein